ncbi:MAG: Holliday junction resolvase RuvX [Flavobacteriales bacterium]|jgi:putative Holliday junction resolvase|tara:strand:- start:13625 stop:14035 length:411 start_codon:yes stop_codon:yes gene_type:complete
MPKIIAIDYGLKRIGLAITDELNIIASSLVTVSNSEIIHFLKNLLKNESIDTFVIGKPVQKNNNPSQIENDILIFIKKIKKEFPIINIKRQDERFTSLIAKRTILSSGISKSKRKNKLLVDKVSATIILQSFLENK